MSRQRSDFVLMVGAIWYLISFATLASGPLFQLSSLQIPTWSSLKSLTTFSWCWQPHFPFLSHPVTHGGFHFVLQVQSSSSHGWPWLRIGPMTWIPHDFRNPLDTGPRPGACGIALAYDGADSTAPGMNGWKGARSQTLVMGIGSFGLMMWDTHCSKPGMIDDWIFPPTVRCCTVRCWGCFIMGCATWILKLLESKGIPLFTWIAESVIIQNFSTG